MIICVCKAVSDRHIRAAVNDGASCLRDLTRDLRVGTCCGKCIPDAKDTLSACLSQSAGSRDAAAAGCFFGAETEFAL